MSLIYQALKQTERQASAPIVAGVKPAVTPVVASAKPAPWFQKPLWLGGLVAAAGVAAGTFLALGGRMATPPSAPASAVAVPKVSAAMPAAARVDAEAPLPTAAPIPALPRAEPRPLPATEPPLPTAGPKLVMAYGMSSAPAPKPVAQSPAAVAAVAAAVVPAAPATPAPAPASAPAEASSPAPAAAAVVAPAPARAEPVVSVASPRAAASGAAGPEDLGELFDALNRALAAKDEPQAQRLLAAVQARLPESSTARWRAEAWFAYQTADMDRARRAYRRLLEKVPGDENATLTLVAIERQQQRPEQAREVLSRSLRQNPNSSALRSALDQLNQSEGAR